MYDVFLYSVVVGIAIWVYRDAKAIGVQRGQVKGLANMGPTGWLIACLFICFIALPIYLIKRGEFKRINGKPGGTLAATLIGSVAILVVFIGAALAVRDDTLASLEDEAPPVVTSLIHQMGYDAGVSCVAVSIDRELKPDFYKATATLNNGIEIPITIQDKGESFVVRVPRYR